MTEVQHILHTIPCGNCELGMVEACLEIMYCTSRAGDAKVVGPSVATNVVQRLSRSRHVIVEHDPGLISSMFVKFVSL